jgi:hypothetical protein
MLFQPARTLQLFGWDGQGTMFFPAQSGVFLILFAGAYLAAIWYRGFVWFIVVAKTTAVVFLVSEHFLLGPAVPGTVLVAAVFDGLMGASVAAIIIWQARTSKLQSNKLDGF